MRHNYLFVVLVAGIGRLYPAQLGTELTVLVELGRMSIPEVTLVHLEA